MLFSSVLLLFIGITLLPLPPALLVISISLRFSTLLLEYYISMWVWAKHGNLCVCAQQPRGMFFYYYRKQLMNCDDNRAKGTYFNKSFKHQKRRSHMSVGRVGGKSWFQCRKRFQKVMALKLGNMEPSNGQFSPPGGKRNQLQAVPNSKFEVWLASNSLTLYPGALLPQMSSRLTCLWTLLSWML